MKQKFAAIAAYMPSRWMSVTLVILSAAAWILYQIGWHSPSSMQRYESAQICAALKKHICEEAGFEKSLPADPCGNRDARCGPGDSGTRLEIYGVTEAESKRFVISLASSELERHKSIQMLDVEFYDGVSKARLIETKQIRRQQ